MAKKDVQIKQLFGNLAETESKGPSRPDRQDNVPASQTDKFDPEVDDDQTKQKSYRERVDAAHGKPTTIRLKPATIQRVNLATKKFRVKKGDFYNFAINYFLDLLEENPSILPVTPSKYDIDLSGT